jgi:hypothetical protein
MSLRCLDCDLPIEEDDPAAWSQPGALGLELIANAADERERPPRALVVDVVEAGTYEVIHV